MDFQSTALPTELSKQIFGVVGRIRTYRAFTPDSFRNCASSPLRYYNKFNWLSHQDSNLDQLLQRQGCYHYTIRECLGAVVGFEPTIFRLWTWQDRPLLYTAVALAIGLEPTYRCVRPINCFPDSHLTNWVHTSVYDSMCTLRYGIETVNKERWCYPLSLQRLNLFCTF